MASLIDTTVELLTDNNTKKNTPALLRTVLKTLARLGANDQVGGLKSVLYLSQGEAATAGRSGVATLDQLDPLTCCTGTLAYVDLPPTGSSHWRVLVYDDRPSGAAGQVHAYFDGAGTRNYNLSPTTGLASLKWVEQGSLEEAVAGLRRYEANIADWALDETMKIELAGRDAFFSARIAGGPLPAPTLAGVSTANWQATSVSGTSTGVVLSQALTLADAQAINHDQVVAGRLYLIDFGPDQAGYTQTISVLGVSDNSFSIRGICEANGVQTAVRVNVDSGVFGEEASYFTVIVTDVSAAKRAAVVSAVANALANGSMASALDSAALAPGDALSSLDYVAREFIDLTGGAGYFYKCFLDVNGQVVWFRFKVQ